MSKADIPHWIIHDLRRTARSLMSRAGVRPDIAERTLGHVIGGVEGVYDRHTYDAERASALLSLATGAYQNWNFTVQRSVGKSVLLEAAYFRLPSLTSHRQRAGGKIWDELKQVMTHPSHLRSFAFLFALVMGTFTVIPFLAPYLELNCGANRNQIAVVYSVAGLFTLVGMNVVGHLTDRFGQRRVFLIAACGSMLMTVVATNIPPWGVAVYAAAATGFMLTAAGRMIPAQAMMIGSSPPLLRGRFMNLNNAVSHFGTGIAPLISGKLITQASETAPLEGYPLAGLVAVAFAAAALGLSFLLRPPHAPAPAMTEAAELETAIA